jgi:hypothetical protein
VILSAVSYAIEKYSQMLRNELSLPRFPIEKLYPRVTALTSFGGCWKLFPAEFWCPRRNVSLVAMDYNFKYPIQWTASSDSA